MGSWPLGREIRIGTSVMVLGIEFGSWIPMLVLCIDWFANYVFPIYLILGLLVQLWFSLFSLQFCLYIMWITEVLQILTFHTRDKLKPALSQCLSAVRIARISIFGHF